MEIACGFDARDILIIENTLERIFASEKGGCQPALATSFLGTVKAVGKGEEALLNLPRTWSTRFKGILSRKDKSDRLRSDHAKKTRQPQAKQAKDKFV